MHQPKRDGVPPCVGCLWLDHALRRYNSNSAPINTCGFKLATAPPGEPFQWTPSTYTRTTTRKFCGCHPVQSGYLEYTPQNVRWGFDICIPSHHKKNFCCSCKCFRSSHDHQIRILRCCSLDRTAHLQCSSRSLCNQGSREVALSAMGSSLLLIAILLVAPYDLTRCGCGRWWQPCPIFRQ